MVDKETLAALNVSAAARCSSSRPIWSACCAYSGDLGDRFVIVNLPGASVETIENGVVYSHHRAGVGRIDRQSPIMQVKRDRDQFQSLLARAAFAHQEGPDPEDEGGPELSRRGEDPYPRQGRA